MAPLSTRCCNCGKDVTFCPDLPIAYVHLGTDSFDEIGKLTGPVSVGVMSNIKLTREYTARVTAIDDIEDALAAEAESPTLPPVTIYFIGHQFDAPSFYKWWVDMRFRSMAGKTVVIAPLMSAFVPASQPSQTVLPYWRADVPYYPLDPFSKYDYSSEAIALKDDLNSHTNYWVSIDSQIQLINDAYPGYIRAAPRGAPGNFVNPAHYQENCMFSCDPTDQWRNDSSTVLTSPRYDEFPSRTDIRGPYAENNDTTNDDNTDRVRCFHSNQTTHYSTTNQLAGKNINRIDIDNDNVEGIVAIDAYRSRGFGGTLYPANFAYTKYVLYDPNVYDPWEYSPASVVVGGPYNPVDWRYLLGTYLTSSSTDNWYLPGELVYPYGPMAQRSLLDLGVQYLGTVTNSGWYEQETLGNWVAHQPGDPDFDFYQQQFYGYMDLVSNGDLEILGNISAYPNRNQPAYSYGSTNTYPDRVPGRSVCIGMTGPFENGEDPEVASQYSTYINTSSATNDIRSSPAITLEYVDGNPIFLWDTQWAAANKQGRACISTMAAGDKHPLCQLIRGQEIGGNSNPDSSAPKVATTTFNGFQATSFGSPFTTVKNAQYAAYRGNYTHRGGQYGGTVPVHYWMTGTAEPAAFDMTTSNSNGYHQYWSLRNIPAYIETPDPPDTGDVEEDARITAELQDWQAFTIIRGSALDGKGISTYGPSVEWPSNDASGPLGETTQEYRDRLDRWYKHTHNAVVHTMGWSPDAELTPDLQWALRDGSTLSHATLYSSGYNLDPDYTGCISNLLNASTAIRVTQGKGRGGPYYSPWNIAYDVEVPTSYMQSTELYFGTVRENGDAFKNFDNSYPRFQSNEYEIDGDTISRVYEEAKGTVVPVLFVDDRQYAAFNIHEFNGGTPETYGLMTDMIDITNYPNHTGNALEVTGDEEFLSIGYGIHLDGRDFPLGVNQGSRTRFAPLFGERTSDSTLIRGGIHSIVGEMQVELLFSNDALLPNRFSSQIQYPEA